MLDEMIFDQIRQLSLDPDYAPDQIPEEDHRGVLLQEISKVEKQISRLLDLYGLDQMPVTQLQTKIAQLSEKKSQLEAQLKNYPKTKLDRDRIRAMVGGFEDLIAHGSYEEIRAVLFELIDVIYLDGEDIEIHWKF